MAAKLNIKEVYDCITLHLDLNTSFVVNGLMYPPQTWLLVANVMALPIISQETISTSREKIMYLIIIVLTQLKIENGWF